ncbi:hypothetical protein F4780DRAFT_20953 [Xylariomycetidae sp. FL0641]|nr:hypothetical protein F4780DRAFT_20953 [Xylariomycetidae sp. FL0641]
MAIATIDVPDHLDFHVNGSRHRISPPDILKFLWSRSADVDGPCDVCGTTFTSSSGPSIRSFSLHDLDTSDITKSRHIRVHNRHTHCIDRSSVQYAAISHVWHDPVRRAHETGAYDEEGASLVYSVPWRVLLAASRPFDQDRIEIWHDYWSVPQWRYETQQQILLYIPIIYKIPTKIFVHLEDYDSRMVNLILQFIPTLDIDPEHVHAWCIQRYHGPIRAAWAL